jgi:hypothetical protein
MEILGKTSASHNHNAVAPCVPSILNEGSLIREVD